MPSVSSIISRCGCEQAVDRDTDVIKDDPEVLPMFREAMKGQAGRKCGDNITQLTKAEKGTSKAYTLTRLQKDNPEEEAKKASRSARAAEMVKAGTHTQAEAAAEVGVSQPAVSKALSITRKELNHKRVISDRIKTPVIGLSADPHRTAANIHAASSTSAGRGRSPIPKVQISTPRRLGIKVIPIQSNEKPARL
jgi:predicted transcriptional regulator